jgi:hypothetical protein
MEKNNQPLPQPAKTPPPASDSPPAPPESQVIVQAEDKKKLATKKAIFTTLALVAAAVVFVGGFFAYKNYFQKRTASQPPEAPQPSSVPVESPKPEEPTVSETESLSKITSSGCDELFRNEDYGLEFCYPSNWETAEDQQHFEKTRDLITVYIWGETQKPETEFYDGASFAAGAPVRTNLDADVWVKDNYPEKSIEDLPTKFSQEAKGGQTFEKVEVCYSMGCSVYYHIEYGDYLYSFMADAVGPDEAEYTETLDKIFASINFF